MRLSHGLSKQSGLLACDPEDLLEGDPTPGSFQIRNDSFEAVKSQIVMSLKATQKKLSTPTSTGISGFTWEVAADRLFYL
jgi:hypothetical protein